MRFLLSNRRTFVFIFLGILLWMAAACVGQSSSTNVATPLPSATLIPSETTTPRPDIASTLAVLGVEGTQIAVDGAALDLRLKEAAAAQVEQDKAATRSAEETEAAAAPGKTQSAVETLNARSTESARVTATQGAKATSTQWAIEQPQRDLAAAQAKAEKERVENEAWTRTAVSIFYIVVWPISIVLLILGLIFAYRTLLPILKKRLAVVFDPATGRTLFLLDGTEQAKIAIPSLAFGPGLIIDENEMRITGVAPTLELQGKTTARAQAAELARALPPHLREPMVSGTGSKPPHPSSDPRGDVVDGLVRVLPNLANSPAIEAVVHEVEQKLLTASPPGS